MAGRRTKIRAWAHEHRGTILFFCSLDISVIVLAYVVGGFDLARYGFAVVLSFWLYWPIGAWLERSDDRRRRRKRDSKQRRSVSVWWEREEERLRSLERDAQRRTSMWWERQEERPEPDSD